ncbi:hypothetical protein [Endozoicomonas sp. 2B-B]
MDHTAKIYGQKDDELWVEEFVITHGDGVNSASFSPNGCHLGA